MGVPETRHACNKSAKISMSAKVRHVVFAAIVLIAA
jgi:hypothetical protein